MRIEICGHKIKCSFNGCRNLAKYYVSTKGFIRNEFPFCEECMKEFYEELSKIFVPKAIESHFKPDRKIRRKKNEENEK